MELQREWHKFIEWNDDRVAFWGERSNPHAQVLAGNGNDFKRMHLCSLTGNIMLPHPFAAVRKTL
jgi:hypothetical protein